MVLHESVESFDYTNQVFTILRNKITAGEFTHGEALKPTHLAKSLGVSQTPVREALIRLAEKDYIEKNYSRNYIIKKFSKFQYMQLSEIRAELESKIVKTILCSDFSFNILTLEKIFNDQADAMNGGDYGKGLILNREFHGHYLRWAEVPQVADFVENICVITGPILSNLKDRRLTTSMDKHFHAHFISALKERNVEKATSSIRSDIMENAERTCSFMLD